MRAIYFPYTSPQGLDTILRSLLLFEKVSVISPQSFFLAISHLSADDILTPLEKVADECEKYGSCDIFFAIDPKDLLTANQDEFNNNVIKDMKNPIFLANAPKGSMQLYADKITRNIFNTFQHDIDSNLGSSLSQYREGPYRSSDYIMKTVKEPLAHAILLNLTSLAMKCNTDSVPLTDSKSSHRAYLYKSAEKDRTYGVQLAVDRVSRVALPKADGLNVRSILDFRDSHKQEMSRLWRSVEECQAKLADQVSYTTQMLVEDLNANFQRLRDAITSTDSSFKLSAGLSVVGISLGLVFQSPEATASAAIPTIYTGFEVIRQNCKLSRNGLSYLVEMEKEFGN